MVPRNTVRSHKRPLKEIKDEPRRSKKLQVTVTQPSRQEPKAQRVWLEEICEWDSCLLLSQPQESQEWILQFTGELYQQKHCQRGLKATGTVYIKSGHLKFHGQEAGWKKLLSYNNITFHEKERKTQTVEPGAQSVELGAWRVMPKPWDLIRKCERLPGWIAALLWTSYCSVTLAFLFYEQARVEQWSYVCCASLRCMLCMGADNLCLVPHLKMWRNSTYRNTPEQPGFSF